MVELRRLVFGSNCVILCSARIVSFSVRFKLCYLASARIVSFSVRRELCHLVFGSNCVI